MGIFNSGRIPTSVSSTTTIIANGTAITGDIQLKCHLHIDGEVDGDIQTTGNVVIGKSGVARGNIRANNVSVSGRLEGSVEGDAVEVLEGGKLLGTVTSKEFSIESNALFEGESRLRKQEQTPVAGQPDVSATVTDARLEKKEKKLSAV